MKKISTFLFAVAMAFALAGCSKEPVKLEAVMKENGSVHKDNAFDFKTVEEQRAQGRSNAETSAVMYQQQNPRIQGWDTIVKADTTHSSTCPQGDGWAEVVYMYVERDAGKPKNTSIEKATVMCSTVSTDQGCVMVSPVDNWSKHPAKAQDSKCASTLDVPFPLPKVAGSK